MINYIYSTQCITEMQFLNFRRGKPHHRKFGEKSRVQTTKCSTESLQRTTSI